MSATSGESRRTERRRPVLLDLFCKAGGAAAGYVEAGFEVVGVDIEPQPNYPFEFVQADALNYLARDERWFRRRFDAIHASPPCQRWTAYGRRSGVRNQDKPALIEPTRAFLVSIGLPYVIENVPGAPLLAPMQLCGSSFGLDVRRHRLFESNVELVGPPCCHGWQTPRFPPATNRTNLRSTVEVGVWRIPLSVQQAAMGIDWMTLPELSEAVPPAYTHLIGAQLIERLAVAA